MRPQESCETQCSGPDSSAHAAWRHWVQTAHARGSSEAEQRFKCCATEARDDVVVADGVAGGRTVTMLHHTMLLELRSVSFGSSAASALLGAGRVKLREATRS